MFGTRISDNLIRGGILFFIKINPPSSPEEGFDGSKSYNHLELSAGSKIVFIKYS
jgi:hypothetical protein